MTHELAAKRLAVVVALLDERVDLRFAVASAVFELTREPREHRTALLARRRKRFQAPVAGQIIAHDAIFGRFDLGAGKALELLARREGARQSGQRLELQTVPMRVAVLARTYETGV